MSDYELSPSDVLVNVWVSMGAAVLSLILCATVLGLAFHVWSRPHTRPMIDRISFRLLLWSVAFEILYDVAYILVECDTAFGLAPAVCTSSVYFMIAALTIVNYLCTCIAINLMLTVAFHLNPVRLRLERWYVGLSVLIGVMIPLVPAATGHFANDPTYGTCWITADSLEQLMTRIVLDIYLWQILSCAIASFAVIVVLFVIHRQGRELSAALFAGNELNQSIFSHDSPKAEAGAEEVVEKPCRWKLWRGKQQKRAPKNGSLRSELEDKFLSIAFQISLYPISLILVNGIITVGELVFTHEGGVHSRGMYVLYCIYYFLYGGRGIAFAALAFFVDPCFRRALAESWRTRHLRRTPAPARPIETSPTHANTKQSFAEMLATVSPILPYGGNSTSMQIHRETSRISSSSIGSTDKLPLPKLTAQNSSASFDMPSALSSLAAPIPLLSHPKNCICTRSFAGVPSGHLPNEFTDDMDVVSPSLPPPILLPTSFTPESMTGLGVRIAGQADEKLQPLTPDLPDEQEEERLRRRAEVEHRKAVEEQEKAEVEETMRVFLVTKAML